MWQTTTFTAASANLDNFVAIDTGPGDATHKDGSPQGIRVFAQTTNAADEHVLSLVLVRGNAVYAHFTAAVTGTARRTGSANDAGLYVCDIVFDETATSKFDLLGDWYEHRQKNRGIGGAEAGAIWMLGCTTLEADTTLNVQIAPSSVV